MRDADFRVLFSLPPKEDEDDIRRLSRALRPNRSPQVPRSLESPAGVSHPGRRGEWIPDFVAIRTRGYRTEPGTGDAAFALLALSACGVLTFRDVPPGYSVRRILVTTDFSAASRRGVEWGEGIAELTGAELRLLHVVTPEAEDRRGPAAEIFRAAAELERWQARGHIAPTRLLRRAAIVRAARPADGILYAAAKEACDLVVLAATGASTRRKHPPGSTAREVVAGSACPVLVPPPERPVSVDELPGRAWAFRKGNAVRTGSRPATPRLAERRSGCRAAPPPVPS